MSDSGSSRSLTIHRSYTSWSMIYLHISRVDSETVGYCLRVEWPSVCNMFWSVRNMHGAIAWCAAMPASFRAGYQAWLGLIILWFQLSKAGTAVMVLMWTFPIYVTELDTQRSHAATWIRIAFGCLRPSPWAGFASSLQSPRFTPKLPKSIIHSS